MVARHTLTTRTTVHVATVAALYTVLTLAIAPLSYGPIQLRASEALKPLVLFNPALSLGIGIGTFFANIASPYTGPWELIWMPLTDTAGGLLAWLLYRALRQRHAWAPCLLYAATTAAAVALMLTTLGLGPFAILALPIAASEITVLLAGYTMLKVARRWLTPQP